MRNNIITRLDEKANKDLEFFKKSGQKNILKKIDAILDSIEYRIIHRFLEKENIIEIFSLKGHYKNLP